ISKEFAKMFTEASDELLDIFDAKADDDKIKEQVKALFKSLVPTVESGEFDGAMSLRGPTGDKYVVLVGLRLKDGKKVEDAVRKLVAVLPDDEKKKIKLDAQTVEGVKLHSVTDDDGDDTVKKIFGKAVFYLGFRDDAVVFGFGEGAAKPAG